MTADDELLQVERIISRLIARYPAVSPTEIEQDVRIVYRRLAGGRIRDFVPLLVEKAARRDIADWMSESAS
ncbi:hypothetical protein B2J88_26795 [Rhodococcus sp. SRB_17]|uniref:three-helix bundle dimerization domain-containing protein n=1 Tax=Rhodococcus sp. OK302 TaxID=1882769 RepID=UPI000B93EF01|nr:hypothetical protein [Rhodococcus sp. OK302]NMM87923.1 hypothetical protein [Rhodococcus sp. SRB_17]OYD69888.1 hypothetical protein BDB13_3469 [Rhodococcus sp. OK302]